MRTTEAVILIWPSQPIKVMPIKVSFNEDALKKYIQEAQDDAVQNIVEALDMTLKQAMNSAKLNNTYKDQTKNLRSSIGYVLYHNGVEIRNVFSGEGKGANTGKLAAQAKASTRSGDGIILGVLVAGMSYAVYVEAMSYDVITGASLTLIPEFKKYVSLVGEAYGIKFSFS